MKNSMCPVVNRGNAYILVTFPKNENIMEMFPVDWGSHCALRIQCGGAINEQLNVSKGKSCKCFPVIFPRNRFLPKDKKSVEKLFPCDLFLRRKNQERFFKEGKF